uniref:Uncharacterized protein n=1 Tax=Arundo donax TaxID=35708 RepID=A0A0A9BPV2_ARUDO
MLVYLLSGVWLCLECHLIFLHYFGMLVKGFSGNLSILNYFPYEISLVCADPCLGSR